MHGLYMSEMLGYDEGAYTNGLEYLWVFCLKFLPKEHELLRISRTSFPDTVRYIDDLLIYGDGDDSFIENVRTIFQKCREKNT